MPVVCHRLISSYLIFLTRYSSLPELQSTANQFSLCAGFRCLCLSAHDVTVTTAYAHHDNNRNVFGEWVFCYQGAYPFLQIKEKQVGDFYVPSPVSSLKRQNATLTLKIFSNFSMHYLCFFQSPDIYILLSLQSVYMLNLQNNII